MPAELDDMVRAMTPVVAAFESLKVRHFVGGSVASSFHGAIRSTMDVDLVAELSSDLIPDFTHFFEPSQFYVSEQAVRAAVEQNSCFNLIHFETGFKIDVFISKGRPFDLQSMNRAAIGQLGGTNCISVPIATVEDIIVSKLEWFRKTDETSERQWEDVRILMKRKHQLVDLDYLKDAAASVGVDNLLQRLLNSLE